MAQLRVLAVLGRGVVPAATPLLRADDLGVLRGDGIFETMHVRSGRPWLLDEHLRRMARSARLLDIPLPPATALSELADQACAGWPGEEEGALRLICTRGSESGGPPTVFATLSGLPADLPQIRRDGLAVRTATLGVPVHLRPSAPWLLSGAKTLSYAVNMASQRWAAAAGADDVLWVSADGFALEGPTSTLVWLVGDVLHTVPAAATGILAGTTAAWLCANAAQLGWRTQESLVRPEDLATADGVWLTSSVRGAAEIRSLDGVSRPAAPATARILALLGFTAAAAR